MENIFNLFDLEKTKDVFDQVIPKEIFQRECLFLLGLVVADKAVNKEAIRYTMVSLWRLKEKVDFKEVGFNLFIIEFKETIDLERIREGRP